jgi:hypothetical protein
VVRGLACEFRKRKKTERTESIGDGDNDHAFVREPVSPVQLASTLTR